MTLDGVEDGALVFNTAGPKQKAWCAYVDSVDSMYPLNFYGCHAIYLFNRIS